MPLVTSWAPLKERMILLGVGVKMAKKLQLSKSSLLFAQTKMGTGMILMMMTMCTARSFLQVFQGQPWQLQSQEATTTEKMMNQKMLGTFDFK